jgi:hypothetical protein
MEARHWFYGNSTPIPTGSDEELWRRLFLTLAIGLSGCGGDNDKSCHLLILLGGPYPCAGW